ncbi:hypothetical protein BC826DRAFT_989902 [Russula brevipes]|nr:hypothetical protein BC826DRAFT_989902 [Russula brevipes]
MANRPLPDPPKYGSFRHYLGLSHISGHEMPRQEGAFCQYRNMYGSIWSCVAGKGEDVF